MDLAIKEALERTFGTSGLRLSKVRVRQPSFIYFFSVGEEEFVLKIGKRWNHSEVREAIADKELLAKSQEEWASLQYLWQIGKGGACAVNFVTPVAYISEFGALITKKTEGKDLWRVLNDGRISRREKASLLKKAGRALACLHEKTTLGERPISFHTDGLGARTPSQSEENLVRRYVGRLAPVSVSVRGLDIRDVIVTAAGEVFFCDPGRLDYDFSYRSLAHFVVSIKSASRMSPFLEWWFANSESWVKAFLSGYVSESDDQALLRLFVAEKLGTAQRRAVKKLRRGVLRNVPLLPDLIERVYIERYYAKEIARCFVE